MMFSEDGFEWVISYQSINVAMINSKDNKTMKNSKDNQCCNDNLKR